VTPLRRVRTVRLGAGLALVLCAVLVVRVIAIRNPFALLVVAPAIGGGAIALRWPSSWKAAVVSVALIGVTATFGLIGLWGLAFIPSIALLLTGVTRRDERAAS
jgi:hypothetical protein